MDDPSSPDSRGRVSYAEKISDTLRGKLEENKMLSDFTRKQTLGYRLHPPLEIGLHLSLLHGLCTHELLDSLRFGAHVKIDWDREHTVDSIEDWFGRLRMTTSEWSYRPQDRDKDQAETLAREGMLSHQWENMSDELLALDRAVRIPRDAPEIQRMFKAARRIPEWVRDKLQQTWSDTDIQIASIGSFSMDVKIFDVDEFDFLLICDTNDEKLRYSLHERFSSVFKNDIVAPSDVALLNDLVKGGGQKPLSKDPIVTSVYHHGTAWCVEFGWKCDKGHEHTLGVDTTIAWRGSSSYKILDTVYYGQELSTKEANSGLLKSTLFLDVYNALPNDQTAMTVPESVFRGHVSTKRSSSELDERLWRHLASVSPYIPALYRIIKAVTSILLPSVIINRSSGTGTPSLLSSHDLKQILYRYLQQFPHSRQWDEKCVHVHFTSFIVVLLSSMFTDEPRDQKAWRDSHNMSQVDNYIKKVLTRNSRVYGKPFEALIELLNTKYKDKRQTYFQTYKEPSYDGRSKYLLFSNDCYHQYGGSNFAKFRQVAVLYKLHVCSGHMLLNSHPLITWCHSYIFSDYENNKGINLTVIPLNFVGYVWSLYQGGILSVAQAQDEDSYNRAIAMFIKLNGYYDFTFRHGSFLRSYVSGMELRQIVLNEASASLSADSLSDLERTIPLLSGRCRALLHTMCLLFIQSEQEIIFPYETIRDFAGAELKPVFSALIILRMVLKCHIEAPESIEILLFYVCSHQFKSNLFYYSDISDDDYDWAEKYLIKVLAPLNTAVDLKQFVFIRRTPRVIRDYMG